VLHGQMVKQELQKLDRAAELRKVTPEEKAGKDRQLWAAWLQRYGRRLQAEADAGAAQEERAAVMLATNPRWGPGPVRLSVMVAGGLGRGDVLACQSCWPAASVGGICRSVLLAFWALHPGRRRRGCWFVLLRIHK
jgi:hypothetical protein